MFPILYKKNETNFLHNGIGILSDCISATATEERNGIFELEIEYDSDGQFADIIENDMFIKAKANDKQDPQLFRIYAINKSQENDNLVINAQHITYDLAGNFVEKLELTNATAAAAMTAIQNSLAYPTRFTISSTNNTTKSSTKLYRNNPLQMIGGIEGSIIDNWGGEIERDNFRLVLHARRGSDDGVLVAYKKNLTGMEAKFDTSKVVTRIFPFKTFEDGSVITVPGKFIDSPLINNYPFIRILPIDASDNEDVTDQTSLYAAYKDYFKSGGHDKPTVTLEVEFEPLWATEEYNDIAALELVGIGDTITVRNRKMGVDVTAEITKIEYDVISEKNAKVTAGSIQTRLTDAVNNTTSTATQGIQQATQAANTALAAANDKNKIFYGPDEPTGAIKGDVWFKVVDGEYTRTYRFDGVQWQLVVDADVSAATQAAQSAEAAADDAQAAATNAVAVGQAAQQKAADAEARGDAAAKAAEEAKDAATKSQADAASAVTSANNAVSTANQATQNAQDAIDKAQDGFDAAQDALTTAGTAANDAQSALSTASTAAKNAQSALTAASNATDIAKNAKQVASDAATQANTAKTNAQTAMSNAQDAINKANAANANANTREKSIIKSNTAPSNPATDQLWIDTSKTPQIMRRWNGNAWVDLSPTQASQIGAVSTTTYTTDITTINNTLSQKASVTTVNTLSGRVDKAETSITQNANNIALKADKKVVDTLKNTVDNHSTLISQNANAIEQKANASTVDTLTGHVSTAEATLKTQANEIAARITKTDADAKYATQTALTATANSLTSKITSVQTNLDNLQVGGRNLAPFDKWQAWSGAPISKGSNTITLTSDGTTYYGIYHYEDSKYEPNTDYILTFKASLISGSISRMGGHSGMFDDSPSITKVYVDGNLVTGAVWTQGITISPSVGATHTFEVHLRTKGDYSGETKGMFIQPNRGNFGSAYSMKFWDLQIEKGNKATDWTPAPEDMATVVQFNTLSQTLDSTTSRIGNAEGNISALQQTANSFATRISNAEGNISSLTQTAQGLQSAISGKVDVTTYNSFVTQTNSALQSKLSVTDAANKYATQSQLTQTASSLTSQITSVQKNIDNLQIGGRNLVVHNDELKNKWLGPGGLLGDKPTTNVMKNYIPVTPNEILTFHKTNSDEYFRWNWYDADKNYIDRTANQSNLFQWTVPSNAYYIRVSYPNTGSVKIERGSKATDWSPAPEDMATQSQISQLANDINLRVQKGDVINQINVSTEGILIDGKKVHITGQTKIDNAVIKDAMIDSVSANKLTAGTIDANVITVKNINASNIVTGTLDASKATVTNIDASKITTGTLNAARIAAGSIDASKLAAGTITAASGVISSLDASKITTGTLDAARVSVVNLNANSITSGTLKAIKIEGAYGTFTGTVEGAIIKSSDTPNYDDPNYTNRAMLANGALKIESSTDLLGAYGTVEISNGKVHAKGKAGLLSLPGSYSPPADNFTDYGSGYIYSLNDLYISCNTVAVGNLIGAGLIIDADSYGAKLQLGKYSIEGYYDSPGLLVSGETHFGNIELNGYNSIQNYNDALYLESANKSVEIKGDGVRLSVGTDGSGPRIYSPAFSSRTYTSSSNAHITDAGVIGITSSARKYKLDEKPVPNDLAYKILDVVPKTWFDKKAVETYSKLLTKQANGEQVDWDAEDIPYIERIPGVVAEDVEDAGLSQYVIYSKPDENGNRNVESVMYDRLWTLLIPVVKDHKERLSIVEEQNNNLLLKVASLELELADIKQKLGAA